MTDTPLQSSMLDGTDFVARLDAVEQRLEGRLAAEVPNGLTDPDPDGTERWQAGQVWSHMAEFIPYWQGEVESVIAAFDGDPVPFGRLKDDPDRLAGVDMGRHEPVRELRARVHEAIEAAKRFLAGLTPAEWNAIGRHPTRGEMDVEAIVGRFIVDHLEEHTAQLDKLAAGADSPAGS